MVTTPLIRFDPFSANPSVALQRAPHGEKRGGEVNLEGSAFDETTPDMIGCFFAAAT
jgi:hypothetical protein